MLFRADCQWCGDRVRTVSPAGRREFRSAHQVSCGASGNLSWLADMRDLVAGSDHGSDLVAGPRTVDLRDGARVSGAA